MSWSEQIWLVATFSYLIWILLLWYIIIDVMTSSPHRILTPSNTNITTCKLSLYYHFSSLPLYLLPAYVPSTSLFTFQCHPFLLLLCILMYPSQPKKNIFTNACRSNSKEGFVFLFCFLFFFGGGGHRGRNWFLPLWKLICNTVENLFLTLLKLYFFTWALYLHLNVPTCQSHAVRFWLHCI